MTVKKFNEVRKDAELTKLEFIRLLVSVGGVTPEAMVTAKGDPSLAYFWMMFDMAQSFNKSDPEIEPALDALVALGYIEDKQSVLDSWPTI